MITIEFKRVLKESIIIFVVLCGLLTGILTTDKDTYLAPVIEIFLLIYASFTGWSMFDRERNEGAMEYLLSLPVSRTRLFLVKLLPRVSSAALMLLFYLVLHSRFDFPSLLPAADFSFFYIAFFLVSLSFSLSLKSFIGAFLLTAILSGGLALLNDLLYPAAADSSVYMQANAPLIIFPIMFFFMFQAFDIKPAFSFNMKFTALAVAALVLIVGVTYLFSLSKWCHCFLTGTGDMLITSHSKSQFIKKGQDPQRIVELSSCQYPLREKGTTLYLMKNGRGEAPDEVGRLDLETGQFETLWQLHDDWHVALLTPGDTGIIQDNRFYVLLKRTAGNERRHKILEIAADEIKETPINGNFKDNPLAALAHVSQEPDLPPFFVIGESALFAVTETGDAVPLAEAKFLAVWKNRVLIFDDSGMTLYRLSSELRPLFHEKGDIRKMRRKFGSIFQRKVLVRKNGKAFIFNLEDPGFQEIPMPYSPYFYLERGNRFYIVWAREDEISVGEIVNGRLVMKKEWVTAIIPQPWRLVRVYSPGVVVYSQKQFETYLFE